MVFDAKSYIWHTRCGIIATNALVLLKNDSYTYVSLKSRHAGPIGHACRHALNGSGKALFQKVRCSTLSCDKQISVKGVPLERKIAWESYSEQQIEELDALASRYIDFISNNKTERGSYAYFPFPAIRR